MKTYKLTVSSPDGALFSGDAVMIKLRGIEGDLAVLADHIPFTTVVKPCECAVSLPDGTVRKARIESGLLTVSKSETLLMTGSFEWI